jgi:16S rRNA (guanine527-N7)-methyltransferase
MNGPDLRLAELCPGVSRETEARLRNFELLLRRWNPTINLVGKGDLEDVWARHILDSAQLWALRPQRPGDWLDVGTGGGFPGVVIAAIASQLAPEARFEFVDSDRRKAAFLSTAIRELGLRARVSVARIEALPPRAAAVLSARAMAPLAELIGHARRHRDPAGVALFPKGRSYHKELDEALQQWNFDYRLHSSRSGAGGVIIEIGAIHGPNEPHHPCPRQSEGRGGQDDHGDQSRDGAGGARPAGPPD